mgnify:CR=1 FL=1
MEAMIAITIFIVLFGMIWYLSKRSQGKDDESLLHNIRRSAEGGDPIAQFKLATMYYEGRGVSRDDTEAAMWYLRAAQQEHVEAQFVLGVMYEKGEGVERNDDKAYKWISLAARQGHARARTVLESEKWIDYQESIQGSAIKQEDPEKIQEVSPEQIAEYIRKADQGDVDAQYNLGIIYYHGEGVARNFEEALSWFHKAAEQNDADAQYNLGRLYLDAAGPDRDPKQAARWLKLAARKGHPGAMAMLGQMLFSGDIDMPRRSVQGLMWLTIARARAQSGTDEWIRDAQEQAFSVASEPERRQAVQLAQDWIAKNGN